MKTAKVKFYSKNGYSKPYNYLVDDYIGKQLSRGEWVVVESARSKYGIGLFDGFEDVTDQDKLSIIDKAVVQGTEIIEDGFEDEESPVWEGVL